jgi:adenine-specific DNA methylase
VRGITGIEAVVTRRESGPLTLSIVAVWRRRGKRRATESEKQLRSDENGGSLNTRQPRQRIRGQEPEGG